MGVPVVDERRPGHGGELRLGGVPSTRTELARGLFAPLGPTYDRYANVLSFGQDPRWRRFLVSRRRRSARTRPCSTSPPGTGGRLAGARPPDGLLGRRRRPEPGDARRGAAPARRESRVRLVEASAEDAAVRGRLLRRRSPSPTCSATWTTLPRRLRELARVRAAGRRPSPCSSSASRRGPLRARSGSSGCDVGLPLAGRHLAGLVRGRPLPRAEHRDLDERCRCRACSTLLARRRLEDAQARAPQPRRRHRALGPARVTRRAAGVLRARPGRLARLRHAAPPAVHGLAPELRRDRRRARAEALRRAGSPPRWSRSSSRSGSARTRSTSCTGGRCRRGSPSAC